MAVEAFLTCPIQDPKEHRTIRVNVGFIFDDPHDPIEGGSRIEETVTSARSVPFYSVETTNFNLRLGEECHNIST